MKFLSSVWRSCNAHKQRARFSLTPYVKKARARARSSHWVCPHVAFEKLPPKSRHLWWGGGGDSTYVPYVSSSFPHIHINNNKKKILKNLHCVCLFVFSRRFLSVATSPPNHKANLHYIILFVWTRQNRSQMYKWIKRRTRAKKKQLPNYNWKKNQKWIES